MIMPSYDANVGVACIMLGTMLVPQLYAPKIVPQAQKNGINAYQTSDIVL